MNKARRKEVKKAIVKIKNLVESILDDERDAYDSTPENLQTSITGIESEEAIENLEDVINSLEDAIDSLEEVL